MKDEFYYIAILGLAAIAILLLSFGALERFKVGRASTIVILWSLAIAASCALPPWTYHSERSAGYHILFIAPEPDRGFGAKIDMRRLALEWLIVSAITMPFWWISRKPKV